jgi:hypothetical protein
MMPAPARTSSRLVIAQVALVAATLLVLALLPPAQGKMILVPLRAGAEPAMLVAAIGTGAVLVGTGPLPHSFVVDGNRAALAPAMLAQGVLVFAAPPTACGEMGVAA